MVPAMPKGESKQEPLERWRHFEERYAERVAPFLGESDASALDKDAIVDLVGLRAKADRWRDRYFKSVYENGA